MSDNILCGSMHDANATGAPGAGRAGGAGGNTGTPSHVATQACTYSPARNQRESENAETAAATPNSANTASAPGATSATGAAGAGGGGGRKAVCGICPHACRLGEGQRGLCRARIARDGHVVAENYGRITSLALDPIEKKPLAEFHPGSTVLSVGSYGCNLSCPFCQNARIACAGESDVPWKAMLPEQLVARALELREQGCIGIAYTYNEPLVGYEYVLDCARLAHEAGLKNVLVSNGFVNKEPLEMLAPLIDAANIDLKGFTDDLYDEVNGRLDTVKRSIELLCATPTCHVEVTTLIVPGMNDSTGRIEALAAWLAGIDRSIPLHITRFFPAHLMSDASPTPRHTMLSAAAAAKKRLGTVYLGNM